jgi:hypothetical protein
MATDRRAVIHLGTHKTGTTAFQQCVQAVAPRLRERGVYLLESDSGPGHDQDIAKLVVRPELIMLSRTYDIDAALPSKKAVIRDRILQQSRSDWPTVLVSVEDLSYIRTPAEAEELAGLFADREVTVVVAFREPAAFLESMRSQLRRMNQPDRSPFPDSLGYTEPDSWLVDYEGLMALLTATFGADHVVRLDYDACVSKHGSMVPSLWQATGLPKDLLPAEWTTWHNVSPGDPQTERVLAALADARRLPPDASRRVQETMRTLAAAQQELTELRSRPRAQVAALRRSLPEAVAVRVRRLRRPLR